PVHPWLERGSLPLVCEAAGERARQGDGGVQAGALTLIFDVNCAFGMRIGCSERRQGAEMGSDGDGREARAGGLVAGDLRPGAEVERQQLAPWTDGVQIVVCYAGVIEGSRQVEAEVVGRAEDSVGRGTGLDGDHLLEHRGLVIPG